VGSILLAYDRDPSDATPPASGVGVRTFMSWASTKAGDVKQPFSIDCPLQAPEEGLFVNDVPGGDERLSDQGQVYVATVLPMAASTALGSLIVEYDMDLFIPNMETDSPLEYNVVLSNQNTTDLLRAVANTVNTPSQASDPQYLPTLRPGQGLYAIRFPEGVYRVTASGTSGASGQTAGAPTLTAVTPKAAPAPQPAVQVLRNAATAADVSNWFADYLLNVPSGGADMFWNVLETLSEGSAKGFWLQKLAKAFQLGGLNSFIAT
jgi:hypothetical protein